jgi:hypothetical protein
VQGFELDSLDFLAYIFFGDYFVCLVRNTASASLPVVGSIKYTASPWRLASTAFLTFSAAPIYPWERMDFVNSNENNTYV